MVNIQIKKLSDKAIIPMKADGDAGYDLYSTEEYILRPFERHLFKTNLALSIPYGYYGRICDRSGNAFKRGLHVLAGVIDSTYRGDIGIVLINLNQNYSQIDVEGEPEEIIFGRRVHIKRADRIAQIVFEKYNDATFTEVDGLDQTIRSTGGFGSTGN